MNHWNVAMQAMHMARNITRPTRSDGRILVLVIHSVWKLSTSQLCVNCVSGTCQVTKLKAPIIGNNYEGINLPQNMALYGTQNFHFRVPGWSIPAIGNVQPAYFCWWHGHHQGANHSQFWTRKYDSSHPVGCEKTISSTNIINISP